MVKRLLSVLLILLFLIPFCHVAMAEEKVIKVSLGAAEKIGDGMISVPVNVTENSGLIVLRLKIDYDSTKIALIDIKDSGNLGTAYHTNDLSQKALYLYWNNPTVKSNITFTGTVAQLIFRPVKQSENGAKITLSCDWENYDCIDFDLNATKVITEEALVKYEILSENTSSAVDRNEFLNSDTYDDSESYIGNGENTDSPLVQFIELSLKAVLLAAAVAVLVILVTYYARKNKK